MLRRVVVDVSGGSTQLQYAAAACGRTRSALEVTWLVFPPIGTASVSYQPRPRLFCRHRTITPESTILVSTTAWRDSELPERRNNSSKILLAGSLTHAHQYVHVWTPNAATNMLSDGRRRPTIRVLVRSLCTYLNVIQVTGFMQHRYLVSSQQRADTLYFET
ncbi:hypothetical protein CY34DRAFT_350186 [Suillus luteus UH-Slu-Lm8-n1]|uniref:Uncharacterized protein n=1 Tax=Suillus luteus UH-Slu-Lm8-n1 TaxID=930992 RepID=A0A0D0AXJ7_9AGAM|nr:hypothetical protein CY34DRAFT_350186 [Suillus luteus UH-Slu-Lm8-n1]